MKLLVVFYRLGQMESDRGNAFESKEREEIRKGKTYSDVSDFNP